MLSIAGFEQKGSRKTNPLTYPDQQIVEAKILHLAAIFWTERSEIRDQLEARAIESASIFQLWMLFQHTTYWTRRPHGCHIISYRSTYQKPSQFLKTGAQLKLTDMPK